MLRTFLLLLFLRTVFTAQVMVVEGEEAFVVAPASEVRMRVRLLPSSLGGAVSGTAVHFVSSWDRTSRIVTASNANGSAEASFVVPRLAGHYSIDAIAAQGDAALFTFAVTVSAAQPSLPPASLRNRLRQQLLRNAADGSTLQLLGPWFLPRGTTIRPQRWSRDKSSFALDRAEEDSWFFWLDDAPAKSFSKPVRYYLLPGGDFSRLRITGEQWWPLAQAPGEDTWYSLGRATTFAAPAMAVSTGNASGQCALYLASVGQPGTAITATALSGWLQSRGVTRFTNQPAALAGCRQSWIWISAPGNRNGFHLDRWYSWLELGESLRNAGELTVLNEVGQGGGLATAWSGLGLTGVVVSASDAQRLTYSQPLRGGFLLRGLLPALVANPNLGEAVAQTQRGDLVVSSPRPRLEQIASAGTRFLPLEDIEFSTTGGNAWLEFEPGLQATSSDPRVAEVHTFGSRLFVRGVAPGQATLVVSLMRGNQPVIGRATIRVGMGQSLLLGCLIVLTQTQCGGQWQREIPVAEDEVGGHAFLSIQDPSIASVESPIYTWNRGERNIPVRVRGLRPGRTWLNLRSHDGTILADLPVDVAAAPDVAPGIAPRSCPLAATYSTSFRVAGGDTSLFEPFGGAWWGTGITLVFRRTASDRFELRSSGSADGQFFSLTGNLASDCSFLGSGQGVAGQRVTTAQARGRILPVNGVYSSLEIDYSIGVDGVFGRAIDYRGAGSLVNGCQYIAAAAQTASPWGGIISVAVSTPLLCPWSATSPSPALNLVAGTTGFGPGVVWLEVAPNSGPARQLQLEIAGQAVQISQSAAPQPGAEQSLLWHAGTGNSTLSPASWMVLAGFSDLPSSSLLQRIGFLPGYSVYNLSDHAAPGVGELGGLRSRPLRFSLDRVAPGILAVEGELVWITGIDPRLPLWLAIEDTPVSVGAPEAVMPGLWLLRLSGRPALGARLELRQGGRSAYRGAF